MSSMLPTYVAGLECLTDIKKGSKAQVEKTLKLFRNLPPAAGALLVQGDLPPEAAIESMAESIPMSVEECKIELTNFLYWRRKSLAHLQPQP